MTGQEGKTIAPQEQVVIDIIRTSELLSRVGNACVFNNGLSQAKFNILIILKYYGVGVSQKDILGRMVSTKGNLSTHIKSLAADGYIRRKTSKADKRHDTISLTPKGDRVLKSIEPQYISHVNELTRGQSNASAEHVIEILENIQNECRTMLNPANETEKQS